MSITTITSKADVQLVEDHNINCPKCNHKMVVKEYYKFKNHKRGEHWLTHCSCFNGCKTIDPEPGEQKQYFFVAYSVEQATEIAKRKAEVS